MRKGLFWIIPDDDYARQNKYRYHRQIINDEFILLTYAADCDKNGIVSMGQPPYNSKKGTAFSPRISWPFAREKQHYAIRRRRFDYYPRGCVNIKDGKATIYFDRNLLEWSGFPNVILRDFDICNLPVRFKPDHFSHTITLRRRSLKNNILGDEASELNHSYEYEHNTICEDREAAEEFFAVSEMIRRYIKTKDKKAAGYESSNHTDGNFYYLRSRNLDTSIDSRYIAVCASDEASYEYYKKHISYHCLSRSSVDDQTESYTEKSDNRKRIIKYRQQDVINGNLQHFDIIVDGKLFKTYKEALDYIFSDIGHVDAKKLINAIPRRKDVGIT